MEDLRIAERALDVAVDRMLATGMFDPCPIQLRLAQDDEGDEYEQRERPARFDQE